MCVNDDARTTSALEESKESWLKIDTDQDKRIVTYAGPLQRFSVNHALLGILRQRLQTNPEVVPGILPRLKIARTSQLPKQQIANCIYLDGDSEGY